MTLTVHEMERDALAAFAFLESDFGCERPQVEGEGWSRRLMYHSNTGFAEIYLDERDEMVSVYFGPAGGEKLPLWAVLDARGEAQPGRTDVRGWAVALRRHGAEATGRLVADYMEELKQRRTSR